MYMVWNWCTRLGQDRKEKKNHKIKTNDLNKNHLLKFFFHLNYFQLHDERKVFIELLLNEFWLFHFLFFGSNLIIIICYKVFSLLFSTSTFSTLIHLWCVYIRVRTQETTMEIRHNLVRPKLMQKKSKLKSSPNLPRMNQPVERKLAGFVAANTKHRRSLLNQHSLECIYWMFNDVCMCFFLFFLFFFLRRMYVHQSNGFWCDNFDIGLSETKCVFLFSRDSIQFPIRMMFWCLLFVFCCCDGSFIKLVTKNLIQNLNFILSWAYVSLNLKKK